MVDGINWRSRVYIEKLDVRRSTWYVFTGLFVFKRAMEAGFELQILTRKQKNCRGSSLNVLLILPFQFCRISVTSRSREIQIVEKYWLQICKVSNEKFEEMLIFWLYITNMFYFQVNEIILPNCKGFREIMN